MYNSLVSTGDESTANHRLLDMLRQVTTFGLSLMTLDIRQESTRHAEVSQATYQPVSLSTCQPVNLSTYQPVNLPVNLSTCQPVRQTDEPVVKAA